MNEPETETPLFPLHSVLFPGGTLRLRIFEPRYLQMVARCLREDTGFGVVLIRSGSEVGHAALPHDIGTLVRIRDWDQGTDGLLNLLTEGERRMRIREQRVQSDQLVVARLELLPYEPNVFLPQQTYGALVRGLEELLNRLDAVYDPGPRRLDDAVWVSSRLAEVLPLGLAFKQVLLELDDPLARLERIVAWLADPEE
ncbi:Lon N-terminal domain-containing protein [Gammaproteobacteria bacterium]